MPKSESVETPTTEARQRLRRPKVRVQRYKTFITKLKQGKVGEVIAELERIVKVLDGG